MVEARLFRQTKLVRLHRTEPCNFLWRRLVNVHFMCAPSLFASATC